MADRQAVWSTRTTGVRRSESCLTFCQDLCQAQELILQNQGLMNGLFQLQGICYVCEQFSENWEKINTLKLETILNSL